MTKICFREDNISVPEQQGNERLATLAKAIGHPARLQVIRMLHEKQSCIGCDIVEGIGLAQSTTSEHLRILKAAGIISGEIDAPRICYSLNITALKPLLRFITDISSQPERSNKN